MRRHSRQTSRSPVSNNSHKAISSQLHVKTQNDRDQDTRSPQPHRQQMRDTWRRPKLQYNKLPQVFQQQRKKYQVIQKDQEKKSPNTSINTHSQSNQHNGQKTQNRNPLNPVKKMIKMANRNRQQLKDIFGDVSVQMRNGPKISQCVYLQVIKRTHNTGTVKKMLHVPTLTLVCVRQQPYTLKQSRNAIRDLTNIWRQKLSGQGMPFIMIHDVLYNYPQGALSVFMQYFKSRSLLNLLQMSVTLPQMVIKQIFVQVAKALQIFYYHTNMHFGGLSPSQIMFTPNNTIKLSLGLFYHIPNLDTQNLYYLKVGGRGVGSKGAGLFQFNNTLTRFRVGQSGPKLQNQKTLDIFKLGLCILQCSIGSFQFYQQSPTIFQSIKYLFSQQGQKLVQLQSLCCLLHSQTNLWSLSVDPYPERTTRKHTNSTSSNTAPQISSINKNNLISFINVIKNRYSPSFLNLLCGMLKLNHTKRINLTQVLNSQFMNPNNNNKNNKTVEINLKDMLNIGRGMMAANDIYQSTSGSSNNKKIQNFISNMKIVMQNCSRQSLIEMSSYVQRINTIGRQIGFNQKLFSRVLQRTIQDVLKSKNQQ